MGGWWVGAGCEAMRRRQESGGWCFMGCAGCCYGCWRAGGMGRAIGEVAPGPGGASGGGRAHCCGVGGDRQVPPVAPGGSVGGALACSCRQLDAQGRQRRGAQGTGRRRAAVG